MRYGTFIAAFAALGLTGALPPSVTAQSSAGQGAARQSSAISVDATVSQVDIDRDKVVAKGDNGRTYTVDTYRTKITLRNADRAGDTADLVPGMRVHIAGSLLASDIIEPTKIVVLPARNSPETRAETQRAPVFSQDRNISLRGTVESVDNDRGSFMVKVNSHTRTVFLDDHTKLEDFSDADTDQIPFQAGDRVSVVGKLASDGTVDATLITPRILDSEASAVVPPAASHGRTLLGRVADTSDYFSRDIKIRLAVNKVITVHVPKDIPITRNGHAISVHDLQDDQVIRVTGEYDGDSFDARRIALLPESAGRNLDF